ncbi:CAAX amino terminal protease family [Halobacteroides halobius DSM 5150]|uniref:CAAX amino terminal protease family n=1 Tax=Halobacteroides halobius (strain ATCC 35273 / DSM 5150 / MD-1) TaxID=748449 RepID=L0KA94_HALHC|nr:type II CAAX endopeptidase family protein [Halobacteroides halobius]AGB41921.1 CAAX amino terminal protease family [Halobacteroides halobius DSM 5150]
MKLKKKISLQQLGYVIVFINLLWIIVFRTNLVNFWSRLSLVAIIQLVIASRYKKFDFDLQVSDLIVGVVSAGILYILFWLGNQIGQLLMPHTIIKIATVYQYRQELNLALVGLLLVIVIGPAEEIFWRGFLQRTLSINFGDKLGYLFASLLYAALHLWTGNIVLIIAALLAGLFWGWLIVENYSLMSVIISHSVWDLLVFVIFPFQI